MFGKMLLPSLVAMAVVVGVFGGGADAADRPHVVFIVADDLGWNDVGFRDPNMHSPNIDRLAREGIILNNTYVLPVCSPSRSAFMSGIYPIHTGLQHRVIQAGQQAYLPANLTILPQSLKKLGYATHMVGKWHLGFCNWKYTPTYRGFDSFMGYYNSEEDYYSKISYGGYDFRNDKEVDKDVVGQYSVNVYEDRILTIIEEHNVSQPLFLYLPFQSVHKPIQVPEIYKTKYCSKTKDENRKTKCGMVAKLDEAIGNITGMLDKRGMLDNLLLVFITDNGGPVWVGGNNWPLRGAKRSKYEGGTRATAFVYSKTLIQNKGTVHDGMIHAVDLFPTIMTAANGSAPAGIDGVSQWRSLTTGSPSPRVEFLYNMDDFLEPPSENITSSFSAAIRQGDWKLMYGPPGGSHNGWYPTPGVDGGKIDHGPLQADVGYQLYNIKDDPTERHDVKEQWPDVVAKMTKRIAQYRQTMVPANYPEPDPASDPKKWGGAWTPGWC